jgi:hypothetical protein
MPRLDENGPCIARRRRGVVPERALLQAGTYLCMILCTSKPRNVYKPNDLPTSQYKPIKHLHPLGNPDIATFCHVTWPNRIYKHSREYTVGPETVQMRHAQMCGVCLEWACFRTFNKRLYRCPIRGGLQPVITRVVVIDERAVDRLVPLANVRALALVDIDIQFIGENSFMHWLPPCRFEDS